MLGHGCFPTLITKRCVRYLRCRGGNRVAISVLFLSAHMLTRLILQCGDVAEWLKAAVC